MNKQVIPYLRSPRKHFWVGLYKKAGNSPYINVSLHDGIFPWEQFRDPRIAWEPSQVITIAWERWELYRNLSESSRSNEINRERFVSHSGLGPTPINFLESCYPFSLASEWMFQTQGLVPNYTIVTPSPIMVRALANSSFCGS